MKRSSSITATSVVAGLLLAIPMVGPAHAAPAYPECANLDLTVEAVPGSGGAGHFTEAITATNNTPTTCWIFGHPGVQRAVSSDQGPLPVGAPAAWTPESGQRTELAPGESATAAWRISQPENYGDDLCGRVVDTDTVLIYLPSSTRAVPVQSAGTACSSASLVTSTVGIFR